MNRLPLALSLAVLAALLGGPQIASGETAHRPGPHLGHAPTAAATPREPGQGAFAAIQEIVALLESDPATDWSRVDIAALHRHLLDMHDVTVNAAATVEPLPDGARFTVTGSGRTVGAIRRMLAGHAATMNGAGDWRFAAQETADGAVLTVTVADPADIPRLRALGFLGVMTRGMHHQAHHLQIARGGHPHE